MFVPRLVLGAVGPLHLSLAGHVTCEVLYYGMRVYCSVLCYCVYCRILCYCVYCEVHLSLAGHVTCENERKPIIMIITVL